MTTNGQFKSHAHRMTLDRVYRAGFEQGCSGHSTSRHYAFPVDRASWAEGMRDGAAESNQIAGAITDWMTRSRPPSR